MPLKILSTSALICERFLVEKDDVFSAIRIIDLFYVPQDSPEYAAMQVNVLVVVKTSNDGEASLRIKLIDPSGNVETLAGPPERIVVKSKFPGTLIPTGTTIALHLNISPKTLGTYYLNVELDGQQVANVPFTLQRSSEKHS